MRGKGICAIALGVLMGLAGVARGEQGVTGTTIEIGAFGPITGPAAYIGLGGRDGANLAVKGEGFVAQTGLADGLRELVAWREAARRAELVGV